MIEEKLRKLEAENAELRAQLEHSKRKRRFITMSEVSPLEEKAPPQRRAAFVSTNAPSDSAKPLDLQTARLEQKAPEEKAGEILERVRTARKGKGGRNV